MTTLEVELGIPLSARLDPLVARVAARRDDWVREGIPARVHLLGEAIAGVLEASEEWVRLACAAKGLDPSSALAGEEWISGVVTTVRQLRLMIHALQHGGAPPPIRVRPGPHGQVVADVFPRSLRERLAYSGMTVEVWMQAGRPASQGRIYREKADGIVRPGRTCLVLGAGNVSSISLLDAIYKLVAEDQVVIVKMHPVTSYLLPVFRRAFRSLIQPGYLEFVEGGDDAGQYLCEHPAIDTIHLTGSDRTHDAIVWGSDPEEQECRKAAGLRRTDKDITSELGCVTPVLVVPGHWSSAALDYQARHVASMVAHNASFNCHAAQALILARGWRQRDVFLERLHDAFVRLPARRAYYPGAEDRYQAFRQRYPNARALGPTGPNVVPWTVIPNVPADAGEYALTREAFCGVLAEVSLDVADAEGFLCEAVAFANEHVWGNLSCVLLADDATRERHRDAVERAVAGLRYGGIGLNVWTGANQALGIATWGAYPGNTLENIGSGRGVVHNAMLFDHPEKSVVRGPFRLWPTPVWFVDHGNLLELGKLASRFEAAPSWTGLPAVALAGLKG